MRICFFLLLQFQLLMNIKNSFVFGRIGWHVWRILDGLFIHWGVRWCSIRVSPHFNNMSICLYYLLMIYFSYGLGLWELCMYVTHLGRRCEASNGAKWRCYNYFLPTTARLEGEIFKLYRFWPRYIKPVINPEARDFKHNRWSDHIPVHQSTLPGNDSHPTTSKLI